MGIVKSRAFFTTIRPKVASHAGIFRGARFSFLGRDEKRAPLKTPAWEARPKGAKDDLEKKERRGNWSAANISFPVSPFSSSL